MKQLILSEWNRLWKRKVTWFVFLSIPIIIIFSTKYLLGQNTVLSTDLPQYTVAWNFPILVLAETLITVFQGIILILITFSVTEEYRTGQLRLVLIRSYSLLEVILAKFIVITVLVLMYFTIYYALSSIIGLLIFPKPEEYPLFYHQEKVTVYEGIVYNLGFYAIAILISIVIISIVFFIAIISQTTTTAIGSGIGFILFSLAYPNILSYFKLIIDEALYTKLYYTSLPMIQWKGITLMLSEYPIMNDWFFIVLILYFCIFTCLTFLMIRKKDSFI